MGCNYTADFETITNPEDCRIWAYGICSIDNPRFFIYGNNMNDFMRWCLNGDNPTCYFHNLKFDGEFIIHWLLSNNYEHLKDRRNATDKTFTTLISDKGQFYNITVYQKVYKKDSIKVTFYDSLKLLPMSVSNVAKSFGLEIGKLEIDYDEYREIGHELTEEEVLYLRNDVEIMARALQIQFSQGLTKMTIGSNALANYKSLRGKTFDKLFPQLECDADIRQSYRGGYTYCNPNYKGKDIGKGIVLDVNSLYPYVMHDRLMPYGEPIVYQGQYVNDELYPLYVQMFTCNFDIKDGMLPTVQLKNYSSFIATQYLESSNGEDVTLCMTNIDLKLFLEHYNVTNMTYHYGYKFKASDKLFVEYIDEWTEVKISATKSGNGGMRTLAKLMLNNLYGKFALNPCVQSKVPYLEEGIVKYRVTEQEWRSPIYVPVGTFVTSWARDLTIRSAQKNIERFCYADTDSLHLIGNEIPEGLRVHDSELGAWKLESVFDRARFLHSKCYIEENEGKLNVTVAGMPDRCYEHVTWDNFKPGTSYPGKFQMAHVPGGIILKHIDFTIKG